MDDFPSGACRDSSDLLGQYLFDKGMVQWTYRSGIRDGQTHGWIERNGLLVDITADQFEDVDQPVMVTRAREWHEQFNPIARDGHPAVIGAWDQTTQSRLRSLYDWILLVGRDPS